MGSFTSVPAIREDVQDADFDVGPITTREALINRCLSELPPTPPLISRNFVIFNNNDGNGDSREKEGPSAIFHPNNRSTSSPSNRTSNQPGMNSYYSQFICTKLPQQSKLNLLTLKIIPQEILAED